MSKIWHKPPHKRKMWKRMSFFRKTVYYLQPFLIHLIDTWQQSLPFPTLFKILYSCFIITVVLLPLIFPIIIIISYYAVIQYLVESSLDIVYPKNWDVIHYLIAIFTFEVQTEKYIEFLNLYIERWRFMITVTASCVDYMRLGWALVTS